MMRSMVTDIRDEAMGLLDLEETGVNRNRLLAPRNRTSVPITRAKAGTASSESFMARFPDPSTKPRLRSWRSGWLAGLLAQHFFHQMLPSLYVLLFTLCVGFSGTYLYMLLSFSRAHAIAQRRRAERFAKYPVQLPLNPAPSVTN